MAGCHYHLVLMDEEDGGVEGDYGGGEGEDDGGNLAETQPALAGGH